ncbi:MAG: hypothetical protein WBM04_09320, partial [Candidatus Korobacteraceae bacterium]
GLRFFVNAYPALKRCAIFFRPARRDSARSPAKLAPNSDYGNSHRDLNGVPEPQPPTLPERTNP